MVRYQNAARGYKKAGVASQGNGSVEMDLFRRLSIPCCKHPKIVINGEDDLFYD